jgi:hypothetical protein
MHAMPIPSQSPRSGSSRGRSRRGGLGRLPKVVLLILGVLIAGYFFWSGDEPADTTGRPDLRDIADVTDNPGSAPDPGGRSATLRSTADSDEATGSFASATPTDPPRTQPNTSATSQAPADPPPRNQPPAPAPDVQVKQAMDTAVRTLPQPRTFTSGSDAATLYNRGDQLIAEGDLIGGRRVLSRLLFAHDIDLADRDAAVIRNRLDDVNRQIFWTPEIIEGDPITGPYKVDTLLGPIAVKHRVPYQLLKVVNGFPASRLQLGRTIKIVRGPLHARVTKHLFLMDVYALDAEGYPVYIRSFDVGLGENDKTPLGNWEVIAGSKVTNPSWKDDLTGEYYAPDNPENPIGEYWIAIEGLDPGNKNKRGFGIHGTIDPDSIGTEASRGCVRLLDEDIELVFSMLTDHSQGSRVQIVP